MKRKIKVGDRVTDATAEKKAFLGEGEVVQVVEGIFCMVLFDVTPPIRYNLGGNPAFMIQENLTILENVTA